MEGGIDRSHIITGAKKVYPVAFLCPGVANKYVFESTKGKLGQGRRVILEKASHPSKDLRRKAEERRGG